MKDYRNLEQLEKWDWVTEGSSVGSGAAQFDVILPKEFNKLPEEKSVTVKCVDNCSAVTLTKWSHEQEYELTLYKSYREGFWERFKQVFSYAFLGREAIFGELVLTKDEFEKIKNFG